MKKVIAIIVSLIFVLSVAGLAVAAEEKKAAAPAKAEEKKAAPAAEKKEAAPAKAEEKKAPAKVKQVTGEVAAVDAAAKTLTVKGVKKGDVVLSADEKAAAELAKIKVGDKVMVKYQEKDGKNIATSIVAKKAAEKKEEKKEMKKEEKKEMKKEEKK